MEFAKGLMAKAPRLERYLLWEAFWDLSTMRINGMGLGAIPLDKMHWYADTELGLDAEERAAFTWIMRRVDSHYVSRQAEKMNKQSK